MNDLYIIMLCVRLMHLRHSTDGVFYLFSTGLNCLKKLVPKTRPLHSMWLRSRLLCERTQFVCSHLASTAPTYHAFFNMGQCFTNAEHKNIQMERRLSELEQRLAQVNSENQQERVIAQLQLQFYETTSELERLKKVILEMQRARGILEESKATLKQAASLQPFVSLSYQPTCALQPSIAIVHSNSDVKFCVLKVDGQEVHMATKRSPFMATNSMVCFVNAGESVILSRPEFAAVRVENFLCPL
jgi:hypothetical protein